MTLLSDRFASPDKDVLEIPSQTKQEAPPVQGIVHGVGSTIEALDLSALTEDERDTILSVLEKDEKLRHQEHKRIYRMKTELSWLRRRGAINADAEDPNSDRACARCRVELGRIINRGAACRACRQRVCKQCREYSKNGGDWVCIVCHKHIEIQLASGEWMNEFVRRPSRRRENNIPPTDLVKRSLIKRSWTISSPPSGDRSSAELRAHSSRPSSHPRKSPRGQSHRDRDHRDPPADENQPPWDAPQLPPSKERSYRRYSMSSYDDPPGPRHIKGPAPAPPRTQTLNTSSPSHSPMRLSSKEALDSKPRRRLPEHPGSHNVTSDRPSTLPRKLREQRSRDSTSSQSEDTNRFHSMPRTRNRSPSGSGRGRSEPSRIPQSHMVPLRENPALGGYISSGPITSTPIINDSGLNHGPMPTPAPRDLSRPQANDRPPEHLAPTAALRRLPEIPPPMGGMRMGFHHPASRTDSGLSCSSRGGGTSDANSSDYDTGPGSRDTLGDPLRHTTKPRSQLPTRTTSMTSGFATVGRPKKPSQKPAGVQRSKSFQVGTREPPEKGVTKEMMKGHVARYVQQLEKGIQKTVDNMTPRRLPLLGNNSPCRSPARDAPPSPIKDFYNSGRSRSLGRRPRDKQLSSPSDGSDTGIYDDRNSSYLGHSGHSSGHSRGSSAPGRTSDSASDIALDTEKIVPEGDDYKLVFISSDSSKDSELNTSIDSDNSGSVSRRGVSSGDNGGGFIEESDWDYYESRSKNGSASTGASVRKVSAPMTVDAAVMTEAEFLSGSEEEETDLDTSRDEDPQDASLHFSLRVPSPLGHHEHLRQESDISNTTTESQEVQVSFDDIASPTSPYGINSNGLLAPLAALDTEDLRAMLRQTEAVQAEAQALQAALMGAFNPMDPLHGRRWFKRGDSTRSSAERSLDELSCHDQFHKGTRTPLTPSRTPHDSPALREYRKRVLTEIQNYYGVEGGLTEALSQGHDQGRRGRSVSPSISTSAASTISAQSYHTDSTTQQMPSPRPSRSSSAPSTGVRKFSQTIGIQTDPDLGGPWDSEDDMTDATWSPAPSPPVRVRGTSNTKGVHTQGHSYRSRPLDNVDTSALRHGGNGDVGSSPPGQGAGGGEGDVCGFPPYLVGGLVPPTLPVTNPSPAFHLHLTLSREASVALTSDSEAEERPPSSYCVSSQRVSPHTTASEYSGSVYSDSTVTSVKNTRLLKEEANSAALSDDQAAEYCSSRTKEVVVLLDSSHGSGTSERQPQHQTSGGGGGHTNTLAHTSIHSIRPPRPAPRRAYAQGRPRAPAMDTPVTQPLPRVAVAGDSDAQQRVIPNQSPVATHIPKEYIIPIVIETSDDENNTRTGMGEANEDKIDAAEARVATPSGDNNKDTAKGAGSSKDSSVTSSRDVSVTSSPRGPSSNPSSPRDLPDSPRNMSSNTSESDDTDDDLHVSRSYDLSTSEDLLEEGRGSASSPSSASAEDTDDDKHVSKEYSLTKSASDSDIDTKEELSEGAETTEKIENDLEDAVIDDEDNEDAESTASADTDSTASLHEAVNQDVSLLEEDFEEDLPVGEDLEDGSGGQGMEEITENICDLNIISDNLESDNNSDNIDSASSNYNKEIPSDINDSLKSLKILNKSHTSNLNTTNTKSQGNCRVVSSILKSPKDSRSSSGSTVVSSGDFSVSGDQVEVGSLAHAQQSEAGAATGVLNNTTQVETRASATDSTPLDTTEATHTSASDRELIDDTSADEIYIVRTNIITCEFSDSENTVNLSSPEETDEGVVIESPVPEDAPDGDTSTQREDNSSSSGGEVPLSGGGEEDGSSVKGVTATAVPATTAAGVGEPLPPPPPPLPPPLLLHQTGESEGRSVEHLSTHHAAGDQTAAAVHLQEASKHSQGYGISSPQGTGITATAAVSAGDSCTGAEVTATTEATTVTTTAGVPPVSVPSSGSQQVEHDDAKEASLQPPGSPATPRSDTTISDTTLVGQTIVNLDDLVNEKEGKGSESVSSSESGHSSAGESEVEEDNDHLVKINISENHERQDGVSIPILGEGNDRQNKHTVTRFAVRRVGSPESGPRHTPPVPSRRNKRSSSSDGVSSSSDIERSDADASDSADTVIEGGKLHSELRRFALQQRSILHDHDDKGRDSDGPSSADSVLHGGDSESQCSDNSEEGNLVSIVSVGDENDQSSKLSSHGRIYIRTDSTDSDVQIKPTCIVVTGSSGAESGDDGEGENEKSEKHKRKDVTILAVTSDARRGHVMSVHVTSPDSSRSTSPARKTQLNDLQTMILTTRQQQQQFRLSPTEMRESSGLANYFTLTLGTDSPVAPRRYNKTPEVTRRKIDRPEIIESPAPTSPASPSPAQTPDHSEGDLLAYEEHHGIDIDETFSVQHEYESGEDTERQDSIVSFSEEVENFEDVSFDETHHQFLDSDDFNVPEHFLEGHQSLENDDGRLDSIEDESINSESYYSESSGDEAYERENDLRGYCNRAIDFTLHTIIEESCEESDYDKRSKEEDHSNINQSELEKYFFFGLGNGPAESKKYANEESEFSDSFSETSSSIFSEGVESIDANYDPDIDPAELASSRLEKYFLTSFQGFERQPSIRSMGEDSEIRTDESDSVGSDSEGSPSPEQPRKKLLRPRGFRGGMASRNQYNLDGNPSDGSHHSENDEIDRSLVSGEDEGSTESEEIAFDKGDGQFDTIKRRKKKKSSSDYSDKRSDSDKSELKVVEIIEHAQDNEEFDNKITDLTKSLQEGERTTKRVTIDCDRDSKDRDDDRTDSKGDLSERKYQSRDSGFIGSSDDLLKDKPEDKDPKDRLSSESSGDGDGDSKTKTQGEKGSSSGTNKNQGSKSDSFDNDSNNNKSENEEKSSNEGKVSRSSTGSSADLPPFSPSKIRNKISRKDSFNAWSSDEETNIMMSKMRAFFKTMIINNVTNVTQSSQQQGPRKKPPQLLMFESKLTNLMKTVPGINDDQVKEIVDYLSSEDTWSDSYDSSDYTGSDLEGTHALLENADPEMRSALQEEISASCQQIIQKFDLSREPSDTDSAHSLFGGRAYSESSEDAFMYQRLMSTISRYRPDSDRGSIGSGSQSTSPPLLAKVMHHIGNRLVALMHEVSGGSENGDDDSLNGGHPVTSSPKQPLFIRKHRSVDSLSLDSSIDKSSLTSTSFESEDSPTDTEQSPESDLGTPKIKKSQGPLSIISERSSAEDFTSLESQRTVFASHESPRNPSRLDSARPSQATASQRSLEERGVTNLQYFVTEGSNNEMEVWQSVTIDEDKFDARELHGVPRVRRSARKSKESRKTKSHMSLEKLHQDEVKNTGERSESLGDLLDRVRSSEFSSSYEQLDSDSTLKASDSLDRHIGSSSSNVRLNASSRGSLTTSSRGSLATSSRGSLNAGSRGSLPGSSGPEEEDEKKLKGKLSFFRYARRSSMPDTSKDKMSPEVRSTTLPRANPLQPASTASLPRSQSSLLTKASSIITSVSPTVSEGTKSPPVSLDRLPHATPTGVPRSARYHAPGYRAPPASTTPRRTYSSHSLPTAKKEARPWLKKQDESTTGSVDDGLGLVGGTHKGIHSPASPLTGGSVGRISGRGSVASLASSTDNSLSHPDEDIERLLQLNEKKRNSLTPLGSRSESMASVYSAGAEGRYGTVVVRGEIQLRLQYNYKEGHLECHVIQCRDLAPVDTKRNRSDPYVKVYLLPDKSKSGKRKTKVKKHTLNPQFEDVLKFGTTMSELDSRTLWVSVWHSDMFGRNDFLGEVVIPLADTVFDDDAPKWYPLQEKSEAFEDLSYSPRGDLILALKFVPPDMVSGKRSRRSRGAMHVLIKEAKGLAPAKPHGSADPLCKGLLLPEKGKGCKQKTSVCRKTLSPTWQHTLVYEDVSLQDLTDRCLELSVWDHDRLGTSHFLGGCRLNLGKGKQGGKDVDWMDSAGMEVKLWEQMLDRPNLWVEGSIMLRPAMDRPIYSSSMTE